MGHGVCDILPREGDEYLLHLTKETAHLTFELERRRCAIRSRASTPLLLLPDATLRIGTNRYTFFQTRAGASVHVESERRCTP